MPMFSYRARVYKERCDLAGAAGRLKGCCVWFGRALWSVAKDGVGCKGDADLGERDLVEGCAERAKPLTF